MKVRAGLGIAFLAVTLLASSPVPSSAGTAPTVPSDFNGDGYSDLAIGVPGESSGGRAGAVNVLYGSPTGITSVGDEFWTLDSDWIPDPTQNFDFFGMAVASGDFDRDGFADLAIGAPGDRTPPDAVGSVTILAGTANGLVAVDAPWTEADLGFVPGSEGEFGRTLASGDFDGDGFADLAVGVDFATAGAGHGSGVVDIIFGSADGLTGAGAMRFSQATPGVPGEPDEFESFGRALTAGDFDGDGIDDLAVGVPGDYLDGKQYVGGVNILYGTVDGPTGTGAQLWNQGTPGIGGVPQDSDLFGGILATGDFDRDGYADLAIGTPRDDLVGGDGPFADRPYNQGSVNVIYGSAAGLTTSGSKWWHQGSAGVPGSDEYDDWWGGALAAGDFDSDGADDLAVGAPREGVGKGAGRIPNAGTVTVLYGSSVGLRATRARTFTQDSPGVPGRAEKNDRFGYALAAGNYGRSSRFDLAIGVPNEGVGNARNGGVVDVLYGRTSGLSGISAQGWSQDSPGVIGVVGAGNAFGVDLTP